MLELGKLKELNIRKVWGHEQYGFSTWLSNEENIQLLNECLGVTLVDIETEKFVGNFRCDILAKDENTNKTVLIENQLEPTNHDHLGKIITYASGLDAAIVVWIVERVREEHASAIAWLNEHTLQDVDFFLIEIHAYQIGDSKPAPMFKIIEQPNNFAKTTKAISKEGPPSESMAKRLEFWNMFNELLEARKKPFNVRKATTDHWYNVSVGSGKCHITIELVNRENKIRVGLYISDDKEVFDSLIAQKEQIESALGMPMQWDCLEGRKSSVIYTYIHGLDFNNQSNYKSLMNQVIDLAVLQRKVFKQYI